MESNLLSEREMLVLQALVDAYVEVGTLIGSQTLCEREGLRISSATVRKTLST